MKKNNKGFFLAEAIIIIALVTTVMAYVYPNVSKLYENYKNSVDYYDQPEDLYALKAIYDYMISTKKTDDLNYIEYYTNSGSTDTAKTKDLAGCKVYNNLNEIFNTTNENSNDTYLKFIKNEININKLYITGYMTDVSSDDTDFKRYLKRLKKTTNDQTSYRLIGVFGNNNIIRYASIKIDNPNPSRNCNLGGNTNEEN